MIHTDGPGHCAACAAEIATLKRAVAVLAEATQRIIAIKDIPDDLYRRLCDIAEGYGEAGEGT